jgi:hypothetical protein
VARSSKTRTCKHCENLIELGSRKQLCDTCRTTPNPRCKRCKKVKPLSAFSRDAGRPSGYFPWCMNCQHAGVMAGAFQDETAALNGNICPMCDTPVRGRANRLFCSITCKDRIAVLRRKYHLTPEQYKKLVADTGGFCPICKEIPTVWQVEHNHITGEVTGVVCIGCNVGLLAHSRHDVKRAQGLVDYLTETPASRLGILSIVTEQESSNLHKVWKRSKSKRRRPIG